MAKRNQPGCPCCTPSGPCTWVVNVNDCLARRSGVTVTVVQGASTWTATTNGSGVATFASLPTGSATATATAPNGRFANTAVTLTLVAGSQTSTITLSAASGYVCCGLTDPIPTTLYLSDAHQGSLAFTWNGSEYAVCYTYSEATNGVDYDYANTECDPVSPQTVSRQYRMTCNGSGSFTLACKSSFHGCGNLGSLYYPSLGRCVGDNAEAFDYVSSSWGGTSSHGSKVAVDTTTPLNLSFAFASDSAFVEQLGTVTVSE